VAGSARGAFGARLRIRTGEGRRAAELFAPTPAAADARSGCAPADAAGRSAATSAATTAGGTMRCAEGRLTPLGSARTAAGFSRCAIVSRVSEPTPIGADAVMPPPGSKLAARLRLALLRARLRGRLGVGRNVHVAPGARVQIADGGVVVLGDGVLLGPGCRIEAKGGGVTIGEGARLGARSVVVALAGVSIGPEAVVGDWAMVTDAEQTAPDVEAPIREQPVVPRPVSIGAGARIGAHAAVLAGATVADREVVGSYAVVAAPVTSP
jgi:acetyltransferase-like isoleucine patch superfamily enzyme